jgi:hypothetical protein
VRVIGVDLAIEGGDYTVYSCKICKKAIGKQSRQPVDLEKKEVSEVERALEESKHILRERYSNPEYGQELLADTLGNLVTALEAEKNQKKLGLNAIFPNAEYVYSESNLDIPEPTITFQTPDQPELGFNSPTWSNMSKPEPKKEIKIEFRPIPNCKKHNKRLINDKVGCEECVETVSIWKDVSKLPHPKDRRLDNQDLLLKMDDGKIIYGQGYDRDILPIQNTSYEKWSLLEGKYCTLTDFVNQVEDMEARLRKLEGK